MRLGASSLTSSFLPFALIAALGGLGFLPACSSHACGLVGCATGATIRLTLPPPTATTFPLAVKTCFNDDCRMAQLAAPNGSGSGSTATFPSTPPTLEGPIADATLFPTGAGSLALTVSWRQNPPGHVTNGDRYTVTVTDAGGAAVASLDKAATYATEQPNGVDCAPTCQDATLN